MGNLFSNHHQGSQNRLIEQLESRLQTLEHLDRDQDGKVSKDEFAIWQKQQQSDLEKFKKTITDEKDREYQGRIQDLQKEIDSLKVINHQLESKLSTQLNELSRITTESQKLRTTTQQLKSEQLFSVLSKQKIDAMVERLIANENINIRGLPDYIERHLYRNTFRILLGLVGEVLDTTSIELMGHQITMKLGPKVDPTPHSPEDDNEAPSESRPQRIL